MDDRISKLPKWAQDEITQLRRVVIDQQCSINTLKGEGTSSINVVGWFGAKSQPLPEGATISFDLADGGCIHCSLDLNRRHVRVAAGPSNTGLDLINIKPMAANCFAVYSSQ